MSKEPINLKIGDSVVFSQHYLNSEPQHKLFNKIGKVKQLIDEGVFVYVEFNHKPGKLVKVFSEDLEFMIPVLDEIEPIDAESFNDYEEIENHDLGGMSRAQLIQYKLDAQENDPALDRSINSLLN